MAHEHLQTNESLRKQSSPLGHRYEQLLLSEKYCDCIFLLSGHQIKCHKLILATASPVFEAMFYGPLCEQNHLIEILDMNEHVFRHLINYIYKGDLDFQPITLDDTIELYYGAEKYLLQELSNDCLEAIKMKLRFSNILPALEWSVCFDLQQLLEICLKFFKHCCLGEALGQFVMHLQTHYYHITGECLKVLVKYCQQDMEAHQVRKLLTFVYKWYQEESRHQTGEEDHTTNNLSSFTGVDDELQESIKAMESNYGNKENVATPEYYLTLHRCYYKACRPFTVHSDSYEWLTIIKSNRFIALHGLTIHSRLPPDFGRVINTTNEYLENLSITITSLQTQNENCQALAWSWNVQQYTKYNCDLIIKWPIGVVLSADVEYQIKLQWSPSNSNTAEYPCSVMSEQVQGIQFYDYNNTLTGGLIKGIHFLNLS